MFWARRGVFLTDHLNQRGEPILNVPVVVIVMLAVLGHGFQSS